MIQHLPILIPLVLLTSALIIPVAGARRPGIASIVSIAATAVGLILSVIGLIEVVGGNAIRYSLGGWAAPIGIEYVLDDLSAFMVCVILVVALPVLIHGRYSVEREIGSKQPVFFAVAMLMLAGFSGIILTGDLFNLYVFLEISSLTVYALVATGGKRSPVAAFRYLIVGTIGASLYLVGLGFIYLLTGSLNMQDLATILPEMPGDPGILIGLVLIVSGVAVKMALFPLHSWLPDAYTYAPTAATALIAPVGTKVAAYILIRVLFTVFDPVDNTELTLLGNVIVWLSLGGILVGSIMAVAQKEMKRMLAYSSVAQIAYIGLGIGFLTPLGLIGALLHMLNHAFMKAALFLVAGNLESKEGHTDLSRLDASMRKKMPWSMAAFTIAALSMVGLPPLAGFFSKWYLILASVEEGHWVSVAVIVAGSLMSAVYFFRVLEGVYLRRERKEPMEEIKRSEAHPAMVVPVVILAMSLLVLGLANSAIISNVLASIVPADLWAHWMQR